MIRWKKRKNNATQHTLSFLRSVSIFAGLSDMQLWYIAQKMKREHYDKGSFIVEEGTTGENCFFISDGSVKITRSSKEGRPVILAILHKSDFFGEMSMFDGEIRSASAVAQEDTKVFTLSRKEFISLVRDFSEISIQLLTDIAERIRKSDQHITKIGQSGANRCYMTESIIQKNKILHF